MIRGISHVAFTVSDMKECLKFYCEVLGFTHSFDIKDDNGNPWIEYIKVKEGQFIELFYGSPSREKNQSYGHLCLEVDNIYEIAERIKSSGYPVLVEPKQGKDKNYQCWAKDPEGNSIEFMQLEGNSPQRNC